MTTIPTVEQQRFGQVQSHRLKAEADRQRLQNSDSRSYANLRTVARVQGTWRTLAGTMMDCPSCAGSGSLHTVLPSNRLEFETCALCAGNGRIFR